MAGVFLMLILTGSHAQAAGMQDQKTDDGKVRVGYYYSALFQEGMSDEEEKSGYAYAYLRKVADYTDWEYEYVYGERKDLLEQLEQGEIDILAGVSMTPQRQISMLFPKYSMGTEQYMVYQKEGSQAMKSTDYSTMDGKVIGGLSNDRMFEALRVWAKEQGISLKFRAYKTVEQREKAFQNGRIDGIVAIEENALTESGWSPVVKVGSEPFYVAVTKKRPELVKRLNQALSTIEEVEPYFLQSLQYDSLGSSVMDIRLTAAESQWLEAHDTLRMGYLDNYMPYCGTDSEGNPTGLMLDVMEEMLKRLGINTEIEVSYQSYPSYQDMVEALADGEVDAVFPAGGSQWNLEQDGVDATAAVVTAGMSMVYKGKYKKGSYHTFSVNKNNKLLYYYIKSNFPGAKLMYYDSIQECLDAVRSGKADATVINGLRHQIIQGDEDYAELSLVQLEKADDRCIGVRTGESALLILLNRGIKVVGQDYGYNASYGYMDDLYNYDDIHALKKFVRAHAGVVFLILAGILVVITALAGYGVVRNRERKWLQKQAYHDGLTGMFNRTAYEEALDKLEDDSLPRDFVCVATDINGLKRVNDTLGHSAGDELILGAAACVQEVFADYGVTYRIGGDEFMSLIRLKDVDVEGLAARLDEKVSSWQGDLCPELKVAVGFARHMDYPSEDIVMLAKRADQEMYIQKSAYYVATGETNRMGEL